MEWIADLTNALIDAGYSGRLFETQYRNGRLTATVTMSCTPEKYKNVVSDRLVEYGQVRTHIKEGKVHNYQILYSLTEESYRKHGIL